MTSAHSGPVALLQCHLDITAPHCISSTGLSHWLLLLLWAVDNSYIRLVVYTINHTGTSSTRHSHTSPTTSTTTALTSATSSTT